MRNALNLGFGSGALIGTSLTSGSLIRFKDPSTSSYFVGLPGYGKSTLAQNLILSDIIKNDKGIVAVDPHGDLVKGVSLRCPPDHADRVIYFSPAEQRKRILGLNPFEIDNPRAFEIKVGAIMDVFADLWYGGYARTPTMQNTLETLVRTLLASYPENKTSFLHMLLLVETNARGEAWRRKLAKYVKDNPALAQNWMEWRDRKRLMVDVKSSRQKIKHILASDVIYPILCQPSSADCFKFQEVLSNKGVLLVNLHGLDDEGQRLLGSFILTQLLAMAKLRENDADRVPCHIYADKFYKFTPQSFVDIINETRKYKMFCTLAHQNLAQLEKSPAAKEAAASCGNVVVFRVTPADSAVMNHHFLAGGRTLHSAYLSNLKQFQAMVRYVDGNNRRQTKIKTYRPAGKMNKTTDTKIRKYSEDHGRNMSEIELYKNDILNSRGPTSETKHQQKNRRRPRNRPKNGDA